MMKLDLLSAALLSAARLTTPAMARKSQVTSELSYGERQRTYLDGRVQFVWASLLPQSRWGFA
jgi:hypothetical protein